MRACALCGTGYDDHVGFMLGSRGSVSCKIVSCRIDYRFEGLG